MSRPNPKQLATRSTQIAIPAAIPDQAYNFPLWAAVVRNEQPGEIPPPEAYTAAVKAEAEAVLQVFAPYAEPITKETIQLWIAPLVWGVTNPPDKMGIDGWIGAAWLAFRDLPAGAFTETTQATAIRTLKFWPAPSEIYAIVSGPAAVLTQRVATLRRISEAPTLVPMPLRVAGGAA